MKRFHAPAVLFAPAGRCAALLLIGAVSGAVRADVFPVTTPDDDGPGSLRQAILAANVHSGPDTIAFQIPGGGVQTISLYTPLPDLTDAVLLDGTTQFGYKDRPVVEIEGSQAETSDIIGLTIRASGSMVRGLTFNRFGTAGILVQNANGVTIDRCFLGLEASGSFALGNGYGLILDKAANNTIKNSTVSGNGYGLWLTGHANGNLVKSCLIGTDFVGENAVGNFYGIVCDSSNNNTFDSNLISGNLLSGLVLEMVSSGNQITGSLIGLNSFFSPLPNGTDGIDILDSDNNTITGSVLAANIAAGILLSGTAAQHNTVTDCTILTSENGITIQGRASQNRIGGAAVQAGNAIFGNYIAGISISDSGSTNNAITNNQINSNGFYGIEVSSSGNPITSNSVFDNGVNGVFVGSSDGVTFAAQVPIRFNSIFANGDLGIWLDGQGVQGGNRLQAAPHLIAAASDDTRANVQGTVNGLPNTAYEIQLFLDYEPNPSGFGDGQIYLNAFPITTDAFGSGSININLPPVPIGLYIAGTATDPNGNTSIFSNAAVVGIPNPIPTVYSLAPSAAIAGSTAFTLTVNGTGFVPGATVLWNGQKRTTNFVSDKQVTASIPASDLTAAGTVSVKVSNPPPGGGDSTSLAFVVQNPPPVLSGLLPNFISVGSPAFTLTVNGSGFVASSTVQWNGSNRPTTFVFSTQLTASIAASDVAAAGLVPVTVFTLGPGGGTAPAQIFSVTNPVPLADSLAPNRTLIGSVATLLTVNGTNFVKASTIRWNGQNRTTNFVSPTQVTTTLSPGDLATAGIFNVTVLTPGPGGGETAPLSFIVANPVPMLTDLSQSSVNAGSSTLTITLSGTNFVPNSVARWNGSSRATTYISPTMLTMTLPRADLATPGNANITVFNPAPEGGESSARSFTINGLPQIVLASATPSWVAGSQAGTFQLCLTFDLKNVGTANVTSGNLTTAKLSSKSPIAPALPLAIGNIAVGATLTGTKLFFPDATPSGNQIFTVTVSVPGRTLTASMQITIPPHP